MIDKGVEVRFHSCIVKKFDLFLGNQYIFHLQRVFSAVKDQSTYRPPSTATNVKEKEPTMEIQSIKGRAGIARDQASSTFWRLIVLLVRERDSQSLTRATIAMEQAKFQNRHP
jgi:hypothetical protein